MVIGDLNDLIDEPSPNNVFDMFINDSSAYYFADSDIAAGPASNWSFPNWPSHLDHILITNELFTEFAHPHSEIQTIKVDDFIPGGFSNYDYYVSDHRPVGIKIKTSANNIGVVENHIHHLGISPNPSGNNICIDLTPFSGETKITVTDGNGRVVRTMVFTGGRLIDFRLAGTPGVYFLTAESAHQKSRIKWYKSF